MFQVRHELAGKVFTCCSFIIKHDYKVTIYLLPHILLYMLLGCTPEEQQEVSAHALFLCKMVNTCCPLVSECELTCYLYKKI